MVDLVTYSLFPFPPKNQLSPESGLFISLLLFFFFFVTSDQLDGRADSDYH